MNKSVITLILLCSCVLSGCRDGGPVDPAGTPPEFLELWQKEQQVIANCYTVQKAVEAFAADNDGVYPWNLGMSAKSQDTNLSGDTVIDLLPGGVRLENPFWNVNSEPFDGSAASPGQTGYRPQTPAPGIPVDYVITGFGVEKGIITITKDVVVQ